MSLLLLLNQNSGTSPANVINIMTGAVTTQGCSCSIRLDTTGTRDSIRMVVSTSADLSNPIYGPAVAGDSTTYTAKCTISGLNSNTKYYYGIEIDGVLRDFYIGEFKTLSASSSYHFRLGVSSCDKDLDHRTYTHMMNLSHKLDMFLMLGDFSYWDIALDGVYTAEYWQQQWDYGLNLPDQIKHNFFRKTPTMYTWSDHDFGINNGTGRTTSNAIGTWTAAALEAFHKRNPNLPVDSNITAPFYYSKILGRCRLICTDLRSWKTAQTATDNGNKTMMGAAQKAWFKSEIDAAFAAGQYIIWMSDVPWLGATTTSADHWGGYNTERVELSNYIKNAGMAGSRFIVMSGDSHTLAVGTADYASGGGGSVINLGASPINQSNSVKTSGWDQLHPGRDEMSVDVYQYGLLDLYDDGVTAVVSFTGWNASTSQQVIGETIYPFGTPANAGSAVFSTNGAIESIGVGYSYLNFDTSGSITVTSPGFVEVLLAGGGGGGGNGTTSTNSGGGGGGGGVRTAFIYLLAGTWDVVVGSGGLGTTGTGQQGNSSALGPFLMARGGGRGGSSGAFAYSGGSSGGAGASSGTITTVSPASTGQGNMGGAARTGTNGAAGGGGGKGGAGQASPSTGVGGNGGDGLFLWGDYYGAGGGGSGVSPNHGLGGLGGGGAGYKSSTTNTNADATGYGAGGGGVGGSNSTARGGHGFRGRVVLRTPIAGLTRYPTVYATFID